MKNIELWLGDCLELMNDIPDSSVDMILADLPYGTTACSWDIIVPFDLLWIQYNRIIKKNGAIVLFGQEPFSSILRVSALSIYKYDWKWIKNKSSGFLNCKNAPMKKSEDILVFSQGATANGSKRNMPFFPQGLMSVNKESFRYKNKDDGAIGNRPSRSGKYIKKFENYPNNILYFDLEYKSEHPTQKPVELLKYLIKTYTKESELVLDNTMGVGSTMVACKHTNRKGIGIEKEKKYYDIAVEKLQ